MDYNTDESFPILMRTCSKHLRERLNRKFKESGFEITSEQWIIMIQLWKQDGLSQQAVADRYERSKVAVFRLIGKLEENGYVLRQSDPVDKRCKRVFLTSEGRKIMQHLIPVAKENKRYASEGISEEELSAFKATLKKMIGNLKKE